MSDARFRELLQRLDTGPEEPRPEFASELWSRIERELRVPAAPLDGEAPLDSEAQPAGDADPAAVSWANERARPRWPRVAVAAVLVVVAGVAIALVRAGGGDESETVTGPAAEPTTVPAEPTADPDPTPAQAAVPAAPVGWSDAPVPECDAPADHALGPDGVLWVGGLGLQRWDGAWTRFTHEDGLPAGSDFDPDPAFPSGGPCGPDSVAPAVSDVEVGPDGTLWMANGAGISTYDGAEFAVVAPYPGGVAPETFSEYLRVDANGDVWFPTFERVENPTGATDPETGQPGVFVTEPLTGIARLDDGTWREFPLEAATEPDGRPLVGDDGAVYWLATDQVHQLVDGTWAEIDVTDLLTLGQLVPTNATVSPDGGLWIAVSNGDVAVAIARWIDGAWTIHVDDLPSIFGQLVVAPDGTLWAPLWSPETFVSSGLAAFDGMEWSLHEIVGVEPTCPPFSMMADETSVWVRGPWCSSLRFRPAADGLG